MDPLLLPVEALREPIEEFFDAFCANISFLYPLKMSENIWFSDVFNRYRNGTSIWNTVNMQHISINANEIN